MENVISPDRFISLCVSAREAGELQYTGTGGRWRACGDCQAPFEACCVSDLHEPPELRYVDPLGLWDEFIGVFHNSMKMDALVPERLVHNPSFMYITVRCRKCHNCREAKRRMWTMRAMNEFEIANRTWFVTLTYNADQRFRLSLLAAKMRSTEIAASNAMVTKFLKRLRKNTGLPIRQLVVHEMHKDGTPHVHMLLHDLSGGLQKRAIQREWYHGFSLAKLGDKATSRYVCKYVAKDAIARVRASIRYGQITVPALLAQFRFEQSEKRNVSHDPHTHTKRIARELEPVQ